MSTLQQTSSTGPHEEPGSSDGPSYNNRKRARDDDDSEPCCIGGCGNAHCNSKKTAPIPAAAMEGFNGVRWWYIKLDSEDENYDSDTPSSLQEESVWSNQDNETEPIKDSEDDVSLSDDNDDEHRWQATHRIEFELATDHSSTDERPFGTNRDDSGSSTTCSSDLEAAAAVVAVVASEGFCVDYFADSSSDSSDPELAPQDKWSCLKCKQKNQPIPRYCQHCFSVRKKWFPPRPRHRGQARRRGAARCLAERSQAEARRSQITSHSFPPLSSISEPQASTSQQDFPFTHPNSQPVQAISIPTPPQTDSSFSTYSKSSLEDNNMASQNNEESLADTNPSISNNLDSNIDNLSHRTILLEDDALENDTNLDHSNAGSLPDTIILEASDVEENDSDDCIDGFQLQKNIQEDSQTNSQHLDGEDTVNFNCKSSQISEDVVDFGPRSSQISEDVVDFGPRSSKIAEDVVDLGPKSSQIAEDVVDFSHRSFQISEDVVDFGSRSSQIAEDVVDFGPKSSQIAEDVVDLGPKSSQIVKNMSDSGSKSSQEDFDFCFKLSQDTDDLDHKSSLESEDVVDFGPKSSQALEDKVNFCHKSYQALEDVIDGPKSSQASEDVVDFCTKSSLSSEDIVDFCPKSSLIEDIDVGPTSSQITRNIALGSYHNSLNKTRVFDVTSTQNLNKYATTCPENSKDVNVFCQGIKRPLEEDLVNTSNFKLQKIEEQNSQETNSFSSQRSVSPISIHGPQSPSISFKPASPEPSTKMCIICETNPADTAFTHGRFSHLCACYQCAKKIYNAKGRCPICRRAASSFSKIYTI